MAALPIGELKMVPISAGTTLPGGPGSQADSEGSWPVVLVSFAIWSTKLRLCNAYVMVSDGGKMAPDVYAPPRKGGYDIGGYDTIIGALQGKFWVGSVLPCGKLHCELTGTATGAKDPNTIIPKSS